MPHREPSELEWLNTSHYGSLIIRTGQVSLSCPLIVGLLRCLPPRGSEDASCGISSMERWKIREGPFGLGRGERHLQYKTTLRATLRTPSLAFRTGIRSRLCAISRCRPPRIRIPFGYEGRGRKVSSIDQSGPRSPGIARKERQNPRYAGWRPE